MIIIKDQFDEKIVQIIKKQIWDKGFNLEGKNLSHISMREQLIFNSNLKNANLSDSDLRHVKLNHSDLSGANLTRTCLYGADLSDVNLTNAKLDSADLRDIKINRHTKGIKYRNYPVNGENLFSIYLVKYGKDFNKNHLRIGYTVMTLEEWKDEFEADYNFNEECDTNEEYLVYKKWFQDNYDELVNF